MDNLQYKDETQNMAKVSLQKGITIHRPSWLSSRIWKIRNYRALQHNCKLFKQKRRYKINLKKTHNETCAQFSVPTSLHLVSTVLAVQVKAKRCSTAFPKKKREPRFSRQSSFQKFGKILHNEGILSRIPSILRNSLFEGKPRID